MNEQLIDKVKTRATLFTVGFVIPFLISMNWVTISDQFDTRSHMTLQVESSQESFNVCEDIKVDVTSNNITSVAIDVLPDYTANKFDEDSQKYLATDSNPDTRKYFFTQKTNRRLDPGINTYNGVTAFTSDQSCNWEPGTYKISLNFDYIFIEKSRKGKEVRATVIIK